MDPWIVIEGARENNLRGIDVAIPRGLLTVVTGVSGSGKSSLAFDTLFREGQRRFLETLPAFSRQFVQGLARPAVTALHGLGPALAVGQRAALGNPRSTVGTHTEIWDLLRLLFARLGQGPEGVRPTRGLFSFNGPEGACPVCAGLGVEDRLDLDLLVADPARSLRQGALKVSTPNGYLMYSQVTLEVLDQVLRAHGGSVDIPWAELGDPVRQVVLYGSERLRVPFGKHPLESRLKWTGITARPRQDGFYRGLVPVMEEILRGKRNDSILRFVRTRPCAGCGGARLNPAARSVRWRGLGIADLGRMPVGELRDLFAGLEPDPVLAPIRADLLARFGLMEELGLDYLACDRGAPTLSQGEAQRLRLLNLAVGELTGLLLVLDEPSAGLHPADAGRLLRVLRRLRDQGQTVVVVEHDPAIALGADWLVDLGPGPGAEGGALLYSGPPAGLLALDGPETPTRRWLRGGYRPPAHAPRTGAPRRLTGLTRNNLRGLEVDLVEGALNVITGVSGAGKTSLLEAATGRLGRVVSVDAQPIGRTPRSNPATYSGAFDLIRDLYAATPQARAMGLGKGHFTFNTPGGRCETCEGAGVLEIGMKHLGTVAQPCGACGGRRFHPDVLAVSWGGRSVAEVLAGSIAEAAELFRGQRRLARILDALLDCGLGHLALGQPATTLSGGEAQRVKLATELVRAAKDPAWILLDEPTCGLHAADTEVLLGAWDRLLAAGHTLLVADNDPQVILRADHVIDLGPGSGPRGGRVVVAGPPAEVAACAASRTGAGLLAFPVPAPVAPEPGRPEAMVLTAVTTHNLKLDVEIPGRGLTVVTGPSGSGKSSLVFDTLLAEARNRFADLVAPWARRFLPRAGGAEFRAARGLRAAVAVPPGGGRRNPRSRVGTVTELDELFRLLYARAGSEPGLPASAFSANAEAGACPGCRGLGFIQSCDPDRLVTRPDLPLAGGALAGTKFGAYLGEPDGQHMATLEAAGGVLGLEFTRPWRDLTPEARAVAMAGCGERPFEVAWRYRRGPREGVHHLVSPWAGLVALVDLEYARVHQDARGEALAGLMGERRCPDCQGERLSGPARWARYRDLRLPELATLHVAAARAWIQAAPGAGAAGRLEQAILARIRALEEAGLGHLAADREMASLSGGEAQRLRLAASLGAGLCGVAYILDEPTRGLHARDSARLAQVLRNLAAAGNAVVAVSHDPALAAAADHILELGPGSGPEGGRLTGTGAPAGFPPDSYTGRLLAAAPPAAGAPARVLEPGLSLRGACLNNLRNLDLDLPRGALVVVTGVSGSGKSSLVHGVVAPSLGGRGPVGCREAIARAAFVRVETLAQGLPGPGAQTTVATALGLAEPLRRLFARTARARELKLTVRHFSTSAPGGRCEDCQGRGALTVAMDLLPDVVVGCETCAGTGFQARILECRVAGRNLAELRAATVAEAAALFPADPALAGPLAALAGVGLGYLRLGQEGRSLSTGEWQRLRLAGLLANREPGLAAVLLDEPARGLGLPEVVQLRAALRRLAAEGHLLLVVEHNLDLIRAADWIIDLGPGGGPEGGGLVVAGSLAEVMACEGSWTGAALRGVRIRTGESG